MRVENWSILSSTMKELVYGAQRTTARQKIVVEERPSFLTQEGLLVSTFGC